MINITCRQCGGSNTRKNGHTKSGQQKYHCKACHFYGTLDLKSQEKAIKYQMVEKLHLERVSQRGVARITGVSRQTIRKILKKRVPVIGTTILPLKERPILELDEMWSYVGSKENKVWIWLALERQTRRIVGLALGDRSEKACQVLWKSLPADYRKRAVLYTDFWDSYQAVLPKKRHRKVDKKSGETNHIERFNNTLCQRCANLVRKTLSYSKSLELHKIRVYMVIEEYNKRLSV